MPAMRRARPNVAIPVDGTAKRGRYILDDQGHLRQHVVVFIDGRRVSDRAALDDKLAPGSNVHVLQALSGG